MNASVSNAATSSPSQLSSQPPSLRDQVVLITGGSRGLGGAIADVLGAEGAKLAVADVAVERAQAKVAELEARGYRAVAVALDVGDEAQVRQAMATVQECFGGLDVLVNNAAIDITVPMGELVGSDWERVLRTNLTGPFLMAQHAVAAMREQAARRKGTAPTGRVGHIVNIASTASKRAWPNASAYHASKWGLLGLSHALHAELRPEGILVSAVVAGGMRTPFLLDRFPDIDPEVLQDPMNVANTVRFVLQQPPGTVVPEVMVLPIRETSWP